MELSCPYCKAKIDIESIDVKADQARCKACDAVHYLSELTSKKAENRVQPLPLRSKIKLKMANEDSIEIFHPGINASPPLVLGLTILLAIIPIIVVLRPVFSGIQSWVGFSFSSILFLFFFISIANGVIGFISEKQTLILNQTNLVVKRDKMFYKRTWTIPINTIKNIRLGVLDRRDYRIEAWHTVGYHFVLGIYTIDRKFTDIESYQRIPTIVTALGSKVFFLDTASKAEQAWAISTLNFILDKMKGS